MSTITTWDVNKDMTVKERVTKKLVDLFPSCHGRPLLLMTSLSFNELKSIVMQRKINAESCIYNVDNLKSDNLFDEKEILDGETKKDTFKRLWKQKVDVICNESGIETPKHKLLFGDILSIPLWMESEEQFALVYADTCNTVSDAFFSWLFYEDTYKGVADDGIMAFTLMLNRGKKFKFPKATRDNGDKFIFDGAKYDDIFNMEHYYDQMNGLTQKIEETNQWRVNQMIHYCEENRTSQMVSVVCKKCVDM